MWLLGSSVNGSSWQYLTPSLNKIIIGLNNIIVSGHGDHLERDKVPLEEFLQPMSVSPLPRSSYSEYLEGANGINRCGREN